MTGYREHVIPIPNIDTVVGSRHLDKDALLAIINPQKYPVATMDQIHHNSIHHIQSHSNAIIPKTDALMTDIPDQWIGVKTADCLPILLYHPKPAIAIIHAGRKGSILNITAETLSKMTQCYGHADTITAYFGPAICQTCYDIGPKQYFDLVAENKSQIQAICPNAKILGGKTCTSCQHQDFYSYRKGDLKHRQWCFMQIRDQKEP